MQNVERSLLLRPTAFKPFVPRSRGVCHFLSPRDAADPSNRESSPSGRAWTSALSCQTEASLSASSNAPYESSAGHLEAMRSAAAGGGAAHSNSDSGRSSSKSSSSLSSRAPHVSPPALGDIYDGMVRDLEEKLRKQELELQQLREHLDEKEAAISQVGGHSYCYRSCVSIPRTELNRTCRHLWCTRRTRS